MSETTTAADAAATGNVIEAKDGTIVFQPTGTSYQLKLAAANFNGPLNSPIRILIRVTARKVYTVPSGGNYITPIFGPPRIVQGRVRSAELRSLVVHAGCPIHVELPAADSAIDLDDGPIWVGRMVNIVCFPGARAEVI
jgi:hypothetical protein